MVVWPSHPQVLVFERQHGDQRVLCAFNFSEQPATVALKGDWAQAHVLSGSGLSGAQHDGTTLQFEPWGGLFLQA
jgi:alpha-glucosidase